MAESGLVIEDIARLAGTSTATVSRVLSNSQPVGVALRERVLEVVRQKGYAPNAAASRLARSRVPQRGQRNRTVALAMSVDRFSHGSVGWSETYYNGILDAAEEIHAVISMCLVRPEDLAGRVPPASLLRAHCDAIIMVPIRGVEHSVLRTIAPVVMVGSRPDENCDFTVVQPENRTSVFQIVQHLYEQGHRRFEFAVSAWEHPPYLERYESFAARLTRYGLVPPPMRRLQRGAFEEYARAFAQSPPEQRPTAIVAAADGDAASLLQSLHECGVRVPGDVSVVGFDGRGYGAGTVPPLTTWRVDWHALGWAAVRTVVDLAEGGKAPQEVRIGGSLLVRGSSGPVPPERG